VVSSRNLSAGKERFFFNAQRDLRSAALMEVLAEETLFVVFKHLSAQDTWRVCLTCSKWKTIWGDRHLWEHFHQRDFGGIPRPPLLPKAWKKSCIDCIVRLAQLSNDDERFSMAVFEGRISLVLGLLASDPSLLVRLRISAVLSE